MTLAEQYLSLYPVDEKGWNEIAYIDDLIKINPKFASNNGNQWARKGSKLSNTYNVVRFHANEMGGKGNKVVAIQLQGFNVQKENHQIPTEVRKALAGKPCVVLGVITSDMEIDHKNGKYDTENYTIDDFQPMSKAANDAKREHCKRCNGCGQRFDAKTLGFPVSFIEGDNTTPSCVGCFWYDPIAFRAALMKGD